jgi:DNA-directed RNA polymerase specialized sigma24 family protein
MEYLHTKLGRVISNAKLSSFEIQVIYHVYYTNRTYAETAKELKRSEQWIKASLATILEKLRASGRRINAEDESKGT